MKRVVPFLLSLSSLLVASCTDSLSASQEAVRKAAPATTSANPAAGVVAADKSLVERGKFLVHIGGCNDCHTPFKMGANGPEPDMSRMLSGHPEKMILPPPPKAQGPWIMSVAATNTAWAGPWGISYTANLTPDELTGLGIWSEQQFIKTLRTGRHWGVARPILPPMPWQALAQLPDRDLRAIYAYLRTVKPIKNQVPDAVLAPPPAAPSRS
jgi:mono/diheme cytochrome c family protein